MITAVDSSIVFDVLLDDTFGVASLALVRQCRQEGSLIACEVVWAEVSARFADQAEATDAMARLGIGFDAIEQHESIAAGRAWREYRRRGGPRTRITSDFLIGAQALASADRLLTRDRGFYRRCFSALAVLDPSA